MNLANYRLWLSIGIVAIIVILLFHYRNIAVATSDDGQIRPPAVAGAFYPNDPTKLKNMMDGFLESVKQEPLPNLRALISPHAGYVFSGPTAAYGYHQLKGRDFKTVMILAPSHRASYRGGSVPSVDFYQTPLGKVPLSPKAKQLLKEKGFQSHPSAHDQEHSLEVQLPFLQHVLGSFELIPIVFSSTDVKQTADILKKYIDSQTLIIASSDLSHFHDYDTAKKLDRKCIDEILKRDRSFLDPYSACGFIPISILLHLARDYDWQPHELDTRNSGDTAGDKSRVVGYTSIAFTGNLNMKEKSPDNEKQLDTEMSQEDRQYLLHLARKTLETYVRTQNRYSPPKEELPESVKREGASFVTLTKSGDLRGCIGDLVARGPLYKSVIDNAINAAIRDHRFPQVRPSELDSIKVEVSVLSPLSELSYSTPEDLVQKLEATKPGIILRFGSRQATYLPQVWEKIPNAEMFLSTLCMKAGLPQSAWQTEKCEILTYTVIKVKEGEE